MTYRGPDGPVPARPRVRRVSRALGPQLVLLCAILLFMVVAYEGAIWAWNATAPKEVEVPKIGGLRESEATTVLNSTGLKPEVVARRFDERIVEGTVMSVDPPPGRQVKVGRTVRLVVSSGSRWVKVPNVKQMSVDRARALIKEAKLVVGQESAVNDAKVPIGYVIKQDPAAGMRVIRNSEMNLVLSRGPVVQPDTTAAQPEKTPTTARRSYDVDFIVPPGPSLQEVRIVVRDSTGEHEVYRASHQVGDTVHRTVSGEGPEAVVQIFSSGILSEEHQF
jgi:serine/threonine-protein kinase